MKQKTRVLVSQCLLGIDCRYDGGNNLCDAIGLLRDRCELIPVCPEMLGGMTTPRLPSERLDGRVVDREGGDVTAAFERGAAQAVRLARFYGAEYALLKQSSPSCGSATVYDGSFTGRKIPGKGLAAEALAAEGLSIFDEKHTDELLAILEEKYNDTL